MAALMRTPAAMAAASASAASASAGIDAVPEPPPLDAPDDDTTSADDLLFDGEKRTDASDRRVAVTLTALTSLAYASMSFVKDPIFAPTWQGERVLGVELKELIALASPIGMVFGKIPSMLVTPTLRRERLLHALLVVAWGSTALMASTPLLPAAAIVLCQFGAKALQGSLWALLMRYMEGRRHTDAIVSLLTLSWIGMSGLAKGACAELLARGLPPRGAVAACALLGGACMTACLLALDAQPAPSALDVHARGERARMASVWGEGVALICRHRAGLLLATAAYVICGALRNYRDFYLAELLLVSGLGEDARAFAATELALAVAVTLLAGSVTLVSDNWSALRLLLCAGACGGVLTVVATLAWLAQMLDGITWVLAFGLGVYLVYMPVGSTMLDRLMGAAGERYTVALLSLLLDWSVQAGTVVLLLLRRARASAPRAAPELTGGSGDGSGEGAAHGLALEPPSSAAVAAEQSAREIARFLARMLVLGGAASAVLMAGAALGFDLSIRAARRRRALATGDGPETPAAGCDGGDRELCRVPQPSQAADDGEMPARLRRQEEPARR